VTDVSVYCGLSNRERLAFVAERDLLLPVAAIAVSTLAEGVAVTDVSVYCGFSNRERLALVADGDLLLRSATPGFLIAAIGFTSAYSFASEAVCLANTFGPSHVLSLTPGGLLFANLGLVGFGFG
jgi:hypothetical protein